MDWGFYFLPENFSLVERLSDERVSGIFEEIKDSKLKNLSPERIFCLGLTMMASAFKDDEPIDPLVGLILLRMIQHKSTALKENSREGVLKSIESILKSAKRARGTISQKNLGSVVLKMAKFEIMDNEGANMVIVLLDIETPQDT